MVDGLDYCVIYHLFVQFVTLMIVLGNAITSKKLLNVLDFSRLYFKIESGEHEN